MMKSLLLAVLPLYAFAADLTGPWNFHLVRFGEEAAAARVDLKADGSKVTGTLNELKLAGTLEGDRVHITVVRPNGAEWGTFEGRLQGDEMAGTVKQGNDAFAWKANRAKQAA